MKANPDDHKEIVLLANRKEYGANWKGWPKKTYFNPVSLLIYRNGAVALTRGFGEHFVYLYPSQRDRLIANLTRKSQQGGKRRMGHAKNRGKARAKQKKSQEAKPTTGFFAKRSRN